MGIQCVDDMLNKAFFRLGFFVGRHPGYFIIVPVLLTLFFITGYQQIHHNIDPEYLFSPVNGEGKLERKIAEDLFKVNYTTRFNVARITRAGKSIISLQLYFYKRPCTHFQHAVEFSVSTHSFNNFM